MTATSAITVGDVDNWLAMGLCDLFEYDVLVNDENIPWVAHTDIEITVSIPTTPTDMRDYV